MIWLYYAVIKDVRYTFRSFNTVNITENYISPVCSFPSVGLWCPITWSVLKTKVPVLITWCLFIAFSESQTQLGIHLFSLFMKIIKKFPPPHSISILKLFDTQSKVPTLRIYFIYFVCVYKQRNAKTYLRHRSIL